MTARLRRKPTFHLLARGYTASVNQLAIYQNARRRHHTGSHDLGHVLHLHDAHIETLPWPRFRSATGCSGSWHIRVRVTLISSIAMLLAEDPLPAGPPVPYRQPFWFRSWISSAQLAGFSYQSGMKYGFQLGRRPTWQKDASSPLAEAAGLDPGLQRLPECPGQDGCSGPM